jgi:acyl-coenzyme A synthetase/AMP-(fatty) acid ligase
MAKTPRLIWLKEANAKFSFAPWLLGSTIFCKDIDNIENMFKTFEANPIDTFCASEPEYHMLDKQQQPDSTHLEQLLSTEPINDQAIKSRWYSATNLHIRDSWSK